MRETVACQPDLDSSQPTALVEVEIDRVRYRWKGVLPLARFHVSEVDIRRVRPGVVVHPHASKATRLASGPPVAPALGNVPRARSWGSARSGLFALRPGSTCRESR